MCFVVLFFFSSYVNYKLKKSVQRDSHHIQNKNDLVLSFIVLQTCSVCVRWTIVKFLVRKWVFTLYCDLLFHNLCEFKVFLSINVPEPPEPINSLNQDTPHQLALINRYTTTGLIVCVCALFFFLNTFLIFCFTIETLKRVNCYLIGCKSKWIHWINSINTSDPWALKITFKLEVECSIQSSYSARNVIYITLEIHLIISLF